MKAFQAAVAIAPFPSGGFRQRSAGSSATKERGRQCQSRAECLLWIAPNTAARSAKPPGQSQGIYFSNLLQRMVLGTNIPQSRQENSIFSELNFS
jgi:hypothetical protein